MHDILIKKGTVVDGTGESSKVCDIAINDDMITEMGDLSGDHAHEIIDAEGLVVAPGFIDISNRSDTRWRLFSDPTLESLMYQGITTIIGGNSGTSLAPIYNEEMMQSMRKWLDVGTINISWQNMAEFLSVIDAQHLAVNFGTFVGYGTLRRGLTGDISRALTHTEEISIAKHISESLKQGAFGVSTGLVYSHEKKVTTEELVNIGKIVAKHNGLFVAHLRDEGDHILESIEEVMDIQKQTSARMHISHLKVMQKDNWSDMAKAINRIEKTTVVYDVYPYTFSATVLYTFLPEWISDGGRRMMLERLHNKKLRERVIKEMAQGHDLSNAVVAETLHSHFFCGKTFQEIAKKQGVSVNEAVINVLVASEGQVVVFYEGMSEENVVRGIQGKNSVISTNGTGYTIQKHNENIEHPRSFGAFPRVYARYVQNEQKISLETMIHKSTGKVAQELGITNRGIIKAGAVADIAIFDPHVYADQSYAYDAYQYAKGVQWLIISGQMAIKYGKYTGVRVGKVLRK